MVVEADVIMASIGFAFEEDDKMPELIAEKLIKSKAEVAIISTPFESLFDSPFTI